MTDMPVLSIGSPAPQFKLPSSSEGELGLADYRSISNLYLFFVREYN